jgi:hypothetical protein
MTGTHTTPSYWLRKGLIYYLPSWPRTADLSIAASQITRITGMSHWYLADFFGHYMNTSEFQVTSLISPLIKAWAKSVISVVYGFFKSLMKVYVDLTYDQFL